MFQRIMVIGSPGAGKSTFSRRLRDITGLPLYYLDMIWHKPDKTNISKDEFDARLSEIVLKDRWIIDGNYQRTLAVRVERCDTVFLLDYPLEVCLEGAKSRIGTVREDLPWTETELDEEFKEFIIEFPKSKLPEIYDILDKTHGKQIIILKSREDAENALKKFKADCLFDKRKEK